jgi:methylmalonyl-CoA/ethylmalonyl-CoA epimerase
VKATVTEFRAEGVTIVTEPHMIHRDDEGVSGPPGWEEWMAFSRDSEGNLVGLASRHVHAD